MEKTNITGIDSLKKDFNFDNRAVTDYNNGIIREDCSDFNSNNIEGLIKEVKEADFAYISNVCVDEKYRGMHIGNYMVQSIISIYRDRLFTKIVLDVLADNPGAIKLYQNLGFEQFTEIFKGFNNPSLDKPNVFSMEANLE